MTKIRVRGEEDYYHSDCVRIQNALVKHDLEADLETCKQLWVKFSDSMAAGWMMLPEDDDEIVRCVRSYYIEE